MARASTKRWALSSPNKKTTIGNGIYSKKPHGGGETFYDQRAGSTPSKSRRRKKPYRGQGR